MDSSLFEELKPILKDKWLDYYEANQRMVIQLMKNGHKLAYGNGFSRPNSEFILGIISVLEPRVEEYLFCFFLVSKDLDQIVSILGLNFNPEVELGRRREENFKSQTSAIIASPQQN